jgi:hypothetical protein|tara:strand:- start:483 stop:722 length:240 start_codon:yes stop_codon:yes gene_type:complete
MEKKELKLNSTVKVILGVILFIFVLGIVSLFTYAVRKMFKILKRDRIVMIGDHLEGVKTEVRKQNKNHNENEKIIISNN